MRRLVICAVLSITALFFTACAKNQEKAGSSPQTVAAATESTADSEKEVRKANDEYEKAAVQQDAAAFERILADDYIITDNDGVVKTKAQFIADARSGDYKYVYRRSEEMKIRVYGSVAILNGIWVEKGTSKGKEYNNRQQYTTVFVKKNGNWQVVSDQVTNIVAPKP